MQDHQGSIARLPASQRICTHADEFLNLMEQRRLIDRRLDELVEILDSAPRLPKSGLRLASSRPGSLLFKGGRSHG